MAHAKPDFPENEIITRLNGLFDRPVVDLAPIDSGQISQVLRFTSGEEEYVLRLAPPTMADTLDKERFILETLLPAGIPVPRILHLGRWGAHGYMVMARAPGVDLEQLPAGEMERLLPELLAVLARIHQADVSRTSGYGSFDAHGRGFSPDWPSFLAGVRDEEADGGFYGCWHTLFQETFLERALFDELYARMTALFPYCPETRFLIHGDYGFSNILAYQGRITAVLDWANALFGDFLFDIAWLDLWLAEAAVREKARPVYVAAGLPLAHYHQRLRCYQYYIVLDSLRYYAATNQPQAYQFARKRIQQIMAEEDPHPGVV